MRPHDPAEVVIYMSYYVDIERLFGVFNLKRLYVIQVK